MFIRIIATLAFVAIISGCADPKAASEENFRAAIQQYLDTKYPKCYVHTNFPATIDFDIGGVKEKLHALAEAGLLSESEGTAERKGFGNSKSTITVPSFDLTDEGKKFYNPDVSKTMGGKTIGGFCIGKATVKDVGPFTEPSDMLGQRISRVNYTYEVSDFPSWANSSDVLGAFKELKRDIDSTSNPIKRLDALILTSEGWVHEKLFKQ